MEERRMADRMTRFLLAAIVLLLLALLVRPWLALPAAQAQATLSVPVQPGQLAVDGSNIVVLQNGKLYLYRVQGVPNGNPGTSVAPRLALEDTQVVGATPSP